MVYSDPRACEATRKQLWHVALRDVARLSGVSERRLREYREGVRSPRAERAQAIAAGVAELLEDASEHVLGTCCTMRPVTCTGRSRGIVTRLRNPATLLEFP